MVRFGNDWDEILCRELDSDYFSNIIKQLNVEYRKYSCFPPPELVFNALRSTAYHEVRAVILGQDPYHGEGQAHGLCFSVRKGVDTPPSLQNIYKEIHADLGLPIPAHGELTDWTGQGVLLLNTILSVRAHAPMSHSTLGWQRFTDAVIARLNEREEPIVFLLWGSPARKKKELITNPKHLILEAPHPSPLSAHRGFFGCKHFSKCNAFLRAHGLSEIDWQIHEKP
ncbi:MAG: uracil-DNA glycosylase [Clostridia bacterium]|nr:uracil-DNA glycosylase [Clostridia bacterium]